MNIKTISLSSIVACLLFIEGCSKNDATPSSCQLINYNGEVYTYVNTKLTSGKASCCYSITYSYDNQNRVIQTVENSGSTTTSTLYYDRNNNVIRTIDSDLINQSTSHTIITYNSSGQRIKQQSYSYTPSANSNPADSTLLGESTYQYPNTSTHNYSSLSMTIYYSGVPFNYEYTYEYDNKVNPSRHLFNFNPFNETDNNQVQIAMTSPSSITTNYVYTYNSNGYPLTSTADGTISTYTYSNCK